MKKQQTKNTKKNASKKTNKKERKSNFKIIKLATIILAITTVSMVSFVGIYKQDKAQMKNTVKDYKYTMALNGARNIKLVVNDENEESKTAENYKKAKEVVEKRLKSMNIQEYNISLDETTGTMTVEVPENSNTDNNVGKLSTGGKFEIIDTETKDVLMDNNDIKSSKVLYNTTTNGTTVYLDIEFTSEGKKELEEISRTYLESSEEETEQATNETSEENVVSENEVAEEVSEETTETSDSDESTSTKKTITMKIDDEEIMTTSFDEPITTGKMQLSVGSASKDQDTVEGYVEQAQNVAIVLDSGNLPLSYNMEKNQYVLSDISEQAIMIIKIIIVSIIALIMIVLIIKYKTNGLVSAFAFLGFAAIYLLLVRYTNVLISIESIFGIIAVLGLDYILTTMLLNKIKENTVNKVMIETYIKFFMRTFPIFIMTIVFCFANWIPVSSFGMIAFWGLALILAYNAIITRSLLKMKVEDK